MKDTIEESVRAYFSSEVSKKDVPPLPKQKGNKKRKENIILAALFAGALLCIVQPGIYQNPLRKDVFLSISNFEMFREEFSRVVFDASQEYMKNKGVKND